MGLPHCAFLLAISAGFQDTTPPVPGTVETPTYQGSLDTVSASWAGFADAESGIAGYEWAIGSEGDGRDLQDFTPVGPATSATASGFRFGYGTRIHVTVRAVNGDGLETTVTSGGTTTTQGGGDDYDVRCSAGAGVSDGPVLVLLGVLALAVAGTRRRLGGWLLAAAPLLAGAGREPPVVKAVTSPAENGVYTTGAQLPITVEFSEAVTVTGAPTLLLETGETDAAAVFSGGSGTAVLTFTYTVARGQGSADLGTIDGEALALNGGTIKNGAGEDADLRLPDSFSAASLSGSKDLVIDTTPPKAGSVFVRVDTRSVSAAWSGFDDPESGVRQYEWAIGTAPGAEDVQAFAGVERATSARSESARLSEGVPVHVTVRVTNGAGWTALGTGSHRPRHDVPTEGDRGLRHGDVPEINGCGLLGAEWIVAAAWVLRRRRRV